ncbi:MAG TPA: hypothetical protein VMR34_00545 [Candidatus Saccharimonadales bacterium]|nr:hypothetical protein [Candidatus Saccharimonadales bacterium]
MLFFGTFAYFSLSPNIEQGWEYAIASFRHHSYQSFGNGVYYTYGPLSHHIISIVDNLDTAHNFIVGIFIITVILALCLFGLLRSFKYYDIKSKILCLGVFAVAIICALPIDLGVDILFYTTLIATYYYLVKEKEFKYKLLASLGLIILSTYKNNYLIVLFPILFIVGLSYSTTKLYKKILGILFLLLLPLIVLLFDGISPVGLPRYLWISLINSLAYSQFMNNTLHPKIVATFFALFIVYAITKLYRLLINNKKRLKFVWLKPSLLNLSIVLGELWVIFIALKEAITRSDQHLMVFLPFVFWVVTNLILQSRLFSKISKRATVLIGFIVFVVVVIGTGYTISILGNLGTGKYFNRDAIVKQVSLIDVINYYNYNTFLYSKEQSQDVTNELIKQTAPLRANFISYLVRNHINPSEQYVLGLNNNIYYLLTFNPVKYLYSPSLQIFDAQPTELYDKYDLNYIERHPNYFIFWDTSVASIDGRLPFEDLPMTYRYIQQNYSIVASDSAQGLYILGINKHLVPKSECTSTSSENSLGQVVSILPNTTELRVNIQIPTLYKIKYFIYKDPVYTTETIDGQQTESFRSIPSSLSDGLYIKPWLPFLTDNSTQNFSPTKFEISSSDNSKTSFKLTQLACSD